MHVPQRKTSGSASRDGRRFSCAARGTRPLRHDLTRVFFYSHLTVRERLRFAEVALTTPPVGLPRRGVS